jgi:Cerato-platanin
MFNPIYPVTFVLALFLAQVAYGLPQDPPADVTGAPSPLRATYDTTFDNAAGSMNSVACSNGPHGLASRFPTFGSVPTFPFIGGAYDVSWGSPNCGGCWNITNPKLGKTIHILAIDTSGVGFNIAKEAFAELNGGNVDEGVIEVTADKVPSSVCGL